MSNVAVASGLPGQSFNQRLSKFRASAPNHAHSCLRVRPPQKTVPGRTTTGGPPRLSRKAIRPLCRGRWPFVSTRGSLGACWLSLLHARHQRECIFSHFRRPDGGNWGAAVPCALWRPWGCILILAEAAGCSPCLLPRGPFPVRLPLLASSEDSPWESGPPS